VLLPNSSLLLRCLVWMPALVSIVFCVKAADTNPDAPALRVLEAKRPLVIGHRGYCQIAPENTLPSFQLAVIAGADLVELDYHQSKDNQLMVIHDPELDRTTDAKKRWPGEQGIKVSSRTAAEIKTLDAGAWFDPKFAGTKIPTLAEALDTIQKGSVTLIERKAGEPDACIKLLQAKGLVNAVVVQAFDWQFLKEFHQQLPQQVLGALGPPTHTSNGKNLEGRKVEPAENQLGARWLDDLAETGAKVAVWNQQVSKEAVTLAHERGVKVWVYTINDPQVANRLLDMGVDGVITNNTSLIWRTLALRGKP
jgi:glycerophosphoryl diester phosphodiesterase